MQSLEEEEIYVNLSGVLKTKRKKEIERLKSLALKELGIKKWKELDFYPLIEPFAYAFIVQHTQTLDRFYLLLEVRLTEEEIKVLEFIKETLRTITFDTSELEKQGERKYLLTWVDQVLQDYMIEIDEKSKSRIIYFLEKEFLGMHKLEPFMRDPNIEDISCDGSEIPIFLYHRTYGSIKSNVTFATEEELSAFIFKLAQKCGKHISISEPMLDATLPDGSRIQMTLSTEVTTKGSTFTIRKFREYPFSPPDLIEFKTMSSEIVAYLWLAVENKINALIAGGTAAGKTSTLNAISLFIPPDSKIVSIEETREINLPHPNWIPGVSRSGFGEIIGDKMIGEIDLYDLMKAALRQRPEYILVGEIRGREAYVLFQAMATGHTTYSTIHADSAQSLIHRLEGKPINIPRIMLQSLDIICIQVISRVGNKRLRKCKQIIEIIDIDPSTKEILTNEVFRWDPIEDKFIYSGKSYVLERIRTKKGLTREEIIREIRNRAELLEWMSRNNIRDFKEVSSIFAQYIENPSSIMKRVRKGSS
jgi:flagellar protein FlaI